MVSQHILFESRLTFKARGRDLSHRSRSLRLGAEHVSSAGSFEILGVCGGGGGVTY